MQIATGKLQNWWVPKAKHPYLLHQLPARHNNHSSHLAASNASKLRPLVSRTPLSVRAAHQREAAKHAHTAETHVGPRTNLVISSISVLLSAALLSGGSALAADTAKVGTCLLGNCQVALAKCVGDAECLENLVCLQLCNGKEDETACQIRCGDLYNDKAVEAFTACAVSDKKCVPQRVDEGVYAVPPDCALDRKFDLNMFQGQWYITAGLNPLFDAFDCQKHFFGVPEPGKLAGEINWRIAKPDSDFIERSTVQTFRQEADNPAILHNKNNPYLHYEDDWYILASKPNEYVFIYYIGNNDAWKGYGGATVYTRAASLPQEYVPELREAAKNAGLDWDKFILTNNTCGPHPPQESVVTKAEKLAEKEVKDIEYTIENDLRSFGKGFTVLEQNVLSEIAKDGSGVERVLEEDLVKAEKLAEKEIQEAKEFLQKLQSKSKLQQFNPFRKFFNNSNA